MEDEDRTWRLQGLYRWRLLSLILGINNKVKERNARVSSEGRLSALLVDFLVPFQKLVVDEKLKKASRRVARNFKNKHDLTGMEMYQMEQDIGRREGPAF